MIFDIFRKKNPLPKYLYTEEELNELEGYIDSHFGSFDEVFHEMVSPDIHLDVLIIEPTDDEPYFKLITEGAGAYKQKAPKKYVDKKGHYSEFVILLPADWNIKSNESKWYWPIGELKKIARVPGMYNTWLGPGHTLHANEEMESVDSSTKQNSFVLLKHTDSRGNSCEFRMKSGKYMNFYVIMPLYPEELDFIFANGLDALLDRIPDEDLPPIVNPNRRNYCV
ncbi:MAG: suppressor of fused domain protein [Lachnospiraceae bacterium]|nr:suppressor of fused domain protein [Lachnospiraceae bacterium]MDY4971777.1 suppressor of fused domain protein [Lachnospiraceae bacterium]